MDLPQEVDNPREKFYHQFQKGDIVWICDKNRIWAAVVVENCVLTDMVSGNILDSKF